MPAQPLPSFAVVVPAYNEERGIEECVAAIERALAELPNETALIVVDDGSADSTVEILERLESLTLVRQEVNQGYGAALRTGAARAAELGFDYVLFMDSDLTNDPRYLRDFASQMQEGVDVIKATRYSGGGGTSGVPLSRVVPSRVGNAVARALCGLPLHDLTNGFRAVRTPLLAELDLKENGFAVIMEELYAVAPRTRGYAEVPIVLTNRAGHLRPTAFDYRPAALWRYLRYPLLAFRRRLAPRRG
jgi:dolichol-phosphate mannosyltransferase